MISLIVEVYYLVVFGADSFVIMNLAFTLIMIFYDVLAKFLYYACVPEGDDVPYGSELALLPLSVPLPPGKKSHFMISYTQRSPHAMVLAGESGTGGQSVMCSPRRLTSRPEALFGDLTARGYTVWLDLKQEDKSEKAMKEAVRTCCVMLPIITGAIVNPDAPDEDPDLNAYFSRKFCIKEVRWAIAFDVAIQPIVRNEDKIKIGELVGNAPEDLQGPILGIDFVDLIRSDIEVRARSGVGAAVVHALLCSRAKARQDHFDTRYHHPPSNLYQYWEVGIRKILRRASIALDEEGGSQLALEELRGAGGEEASI